jgi:hypothetical protein
VLRINLLVHVESVGLKRDLSVWRDALRHPGIHLTVTAFHDTVRHRSRRILRRLIPMITRRPLYDINLFVEDVAEGWLNTARVNCLIPHQEWFTEAHRDLLPRLDWLLCKTRFAVDSFLGHGISTRLIGFTSPDRFDKTVHKDYSACIHVAGSSMQKGSNTVNEVWLRNPTWPTLVLSWSNPRGTPISGPNVHCETGFLDDARLRRMQNMCGIHLCPSEAEGFGHYLVEAMSCKAVVVTTDAPPMNELVGHDRGVLVRYHRTSPQGAGTNFYVDPADLEDKINTILGMDPSRRRELGENAREWYLENDRAFKTNLIEVLQGIA